MADYTLSITAQLPYEETVTAVREQLAEAGFGVLTEIDLKATLKKKLDVDVAPQIILGACRPELAHQALQAEPSIAALLPCNVVVRSVGETTTVVEAFDPAVMTSFAGDSDALRAVSEDARTRLSRALDAVAAVEAGK
ncbi:ABC transporter ATP-binding protein [Nocardioides psychrotolerans]|uniref:Uncharacterized conserved protein, DUF302 family n=1 Tax=Nocardioides psychrotolerans TaxID=1005945 RepID=A0A1I3PFX2_9ACTN|nr:DUF302 domain-containing protein [Nocardioides psychrotolerans]GEP39664.1 ABC transporter ATP-binding protein [Nocardioides psychrotolerans]SFJ19916.1 Uncharacterized conserved protein, DUF302 family [Nocardioides psychrotolerans]